jgi:hypothetical protein
MSRELQRHHNRNADGSGSKHVYLPLPSDRMQPRQILTGRSRIPRNF